MDTDTGDRHGAPAQRAVKPARLAEDKAPGTRVAGAFLMALSPRSQGVPEIGEWHLFQASQLSEEARGGGLHQVEYLVEAVGATVIRVGDVEYVGIP